jgi:hypothetical protein
MRHVISIGIATLGVLAPPTAAQQKPRLEALAWMAGSWARSAGAQSSEEHWTAAAGGIMLGVHRDVAAEKTSFEFLRIEETPEGIVYLASPGGRAATAFPLVEASAGRAVFANPEHDFPQRILYWRDRNDLCAAVEGAVQGENVREEWCWTPSQLAPVAHRR